jgi:hypothetical protein
MCALLEYILAVFLFMKSKLNIKYCVSEIFLGNALLWIGNLTEQSGVWDPRYGVFGSYPTLKTKYSSFLMML